MVLEVDLNIFVFSVELLEINIGLVFLLTSVENESHGPQTCLIIIFIHLLMNFDDLDVI